jgi:hypothetical protein
MKKSIRKKWEKDKYWKKHLAEYKITSEIAALFPDYRPWRESKKTREKALELIDKLEEKYKKIRGIHEPELQAKINPDRKIDLITTEIFSSAKEYFAKSEKATDHPIPKFWDYIDDLRLIEAGIRSLSILRHEYSAYIQIDRKYDLEEKISEVEKLIGIKSKEDEYPQVISLACTKVLIDITQYAHSKQLDGEEIESVLGKDLEKIDCSVDRVYQVVSYDPIRCI